MVKGLRASIIGATLLAALGLGSSRAFAAQTAASEKKTAPTPLQLVQTAHTLFAQGDYESARKYYLEVLPSFPKNVDILRNLAFCYFVMGPRGFAAAYKYYTQAHGLNPQSSELTEQLVKCLRGLNRNAEAAAILRGVAEAPGAPPEAWKSLAQAYDAAAMLPDAEAAYNAYLERNPSDLDARTSLGNVYGRHKEYGPALEQFRIVLSANPNFSPALLGMAKILSWRNQFDESLQLYDRVLRLSPENGEAASGKAFVLLWMGLTEEAQALFEKLHGRFPRDPDIARGLNSAHARLAEKQMSAARRSGNLTRVEALYRQRLTKNPRDLDALRVLATMTATPQRCAESIDFSRRATELSPDNASFALLLANGLALCQQYSESVARYQKYLESNPKAEGAMYDLGVMLARARRPAEAIEVFRKLLEINPNHLDVTLDLAQALAATGNFQEALLRYDQVLKASPKNYDALQGKAFVLFWTGHFAEARAIFQTLAAERPSDPQNPQALRDVAQAEEAARWVALRPAPNAPPEDFLRYYEKRLASYPNDAVALKAVAHLQAELKNTPAAIEGYRRVVAKYPDDRDAKMELARLLATAGKYDESIALHQDVLRAAPDDSAVLDSLAPVYVWANQPGRALSIYKRLLDKNPGNRGYQMEAARLELAMKHYPAARDQLASLVSTDPQNREARLTLARLDLSLGHQDDSLKNYDELLRQDPHDADALLGKAQISYYRGDIPEAETSASAAATERPKDFDTLLLMANIEHARRHRKQALAWLDRADQVTLGNPEATELRNRLHDESSVTMHTTAAAGRELDLPAAGDTRVQTYATTIGFFPRTNLDSYISFTSLPDQSPHSSVCWYDQTGHRHCTAAPWSILFRNSWRATNKLTIRGGAGLGRFGPSMYTPDAIAGATISPSKKVNLDLDWLRSPVLYWPTPLAMSEGLTENRFSGGLTIWFTPHTDLHFEYFYTRLHTLTNHTIPAAVRDLGQGGGVNLNQNILKRERLSLDGGYSAHMYGYGRTEQGASLGYFNPHFYQNHMLTGRVYGKLFGPVGYDFSGGVGIQKTDIVRDASGPLKASEKGTASLSLNVSSRQTLHLSYTYYNSAAAGTPFGVPLTAVHGNIFVLTSDWKF